MDPYQEYRYWIIAIFGGLSVFILFSIWNFYYFKRRKSHERADFGLLFLCAGLAVWVILAIMKLATLQMGDIELHVLSMMNNALIACSFPFFEYSIISDRSKRTRKYWTFITLSLAAFVLLLIFIFKCAGNVLDFLSSTLVLIVLTGILLKTFDKRNLTPLGYFSVLIMIATIFSQFFITFSNTTSDQYCPKNLVYIPPQLLKIGYIMGGISFAMLILLLVALAFTWILDKNDVLDEWKDEDVVNAFWKPYKGKIEDGVKAIIQESTSGLSSIIFKKIMFAFEILIPTAKKQVEFNDLFISLSTNAARFNQARRSFDMGRIQYPEYETVCNNVKVNLSDLLKQLRGNIPEHFQEKAETQL